MSTEVPCHAYDGGERWSSNGNQHFFKGLKMTYFLKIDHHKIYKFSSEAELLAEQASLQPITLSTEIITADDAAKIEQEKGGLNWYSHFTKPSITWCQFSKDPIY